jgi:hypothetical protein
MSPVQKAGLLYLTLVEAYERCGMMQKEHAPDLLLAHDGKAYEVRYHFLLWRYGETHRHYRRYFSPRVSMQSRAKSVHPSSKLRPPPCTSQRSRPIWSQMRVHATMSRPPRYLWARLWLQWRRHTGGTSNFHTVWGLSSGRRVTSIREHSGRAATE